MWLAGNSGPFTVSKIAVSGVTERPLRILHISDLHFAPGQKAKARFVASLAELNPDLVVNTGDNLGHLEAVNPTLDALQPLAHIPGVFVNGSNDYHAPKPRNYLKYLAGPSKVQLSNDLDTKRFVSELENFGWLNLNNRSGKLALGETTVGFMGLDDPHENLDLLNTLPSQRTDMGKVDLLFGVAHAPYLRVIDAFSEAGASMIFAGHTHGGQVCLPGQKALVTNCDIPTQYASGLSAWKSEDKEVLLHVSQGIGCSVYAPFRVFCTPGATLLELN